MLTSIIFTLLSLVFIFLIQRGAYLPPPSLPLPLNPSLSRPVLSCSSTQI